MKERRKKGGMRRRGRRGGEREKKTECLKLLNFSFTGDGKCEENTLINNNNNKNFRSLSSHLTFVLICFVIIIIESV